MAQLLSDRNGQNCYTLKMLKTYLPKMTTRIFGLFIVLSFFAGCYKTSLFLLALLAGATYLFRKRLVIIDDRPSAHKQIIYAPISGSVKKISKGVSHPIFGHDLIELQLCLPWWREMGLYFPIAGAIKKTIKVQGATFFRWNQWKSQNQKSLCNDLLGISIENEDNEKFGLQLLKCPLGLHPRVWVMPNDRARAATNFGYFPLGGTVLLYLPKYYKILIKMGDQVIAGETLISGKP